MSIFDLHTIESAPEASKQMMRDSEKAYGFLPNLYRNMSEAPALLEGYLTLSKIVDTTSFHETEKQIVLMTNNRLNGCTYCMAAHTTLSQMGGVADDVITSLREGTPIADARLEALRQFSIIVNETRGYPTEAQMAAFLEAGFTKQNMLEVLLATALKVLSNYTNHLAHTPLDAAFVPNTWAKD